MSPGLAPAHIYSRGATHGTDKANLISISIRVQYQPRSRAKHMTFRDSSSPSTTPVRLLPRVLSRAVFLLISVRRVALTLGDRPAVAARFMHVAHAECTVHYRFRTGFLVGAAAMMAPSSDWNTGMMLKW